MHQLELSMYGRYMRGCCSYSLNACTLRNTAASNAVGQSLSRASVLETWQAHAASNTVPCSSARLLSRITNEDLG